MVDFLIVGAQKCGTTSLHRYLSAHPQIEMPRSKELDFFSNDKYFSKGLEYYQGFFAHLEDQNILSGEASPQYMYCDIAPQRISAAYPDVRLIMCLRDPVERAISHLRMNRRRGLDSRSLIEAYREFQNKACQHKDDPELGYFSLGEYGRILKTYLRYFDLQQILFVHAEDLRWNRLGEIDRILTFLGQDNLIPRKVLQTEFHQSGEQRFPWLGRGIKHFAQLSPQMNRAIKAVVGTDRIYTLLHKIETDWNISSRKNEVTCDLSPEQRQEIASYFAADETMFKELAGYRLPWGRS